MLQRIGQRIGEAVWKACNLLFQDTARGGGGGGPEGAGGPPASGGGGKWSYVWIPVSPGEALDRVTITELKVRATGSKACERYLKMLREATAPLRSREAVQEPLQRLRATNEALWELETRVRTPLSDSQATLRDATRDATLGLEIAVTNDRRTRVKRELDDLFAAACPDIKVYSAVIESCHRY